MDFRLAMIPHCTNISSIFRFILGLRDIEDLLAEKELTGNNLFPYYHYHHVFSFSANTMSSRMLTSNGVSIAPSIC